MAPSRKRLVVDHKEVARRRVGPRGCPCLERPHSDGLCELSVWRGTTIEYDAHTHKHTKLLHRDMHVVKYKDLRLGSFSDCMYFMVMLNWLPLLVLFIGLYMAVTGIFALLFALCDTDLSDREATPRDYFNLSLQTMATIGYGVLFPKDSCSNWVSVVESFVSMIMVSLLTGIAFVKYARPRSQIIFSKVFTVSRREGGPDGGLEMRFRIVNGTRRELIMKGEILEVNFKLVLLRIEETKTGEKKLCSYDLHLKTTSYITLRLEADIIHEIEEDSPFYGMTKDDIAKSDFLLILMMSGVDETLHDTVNEQYEYTHENMRWGAKFVPVLTWDRLANDIELDFEHISATLPAPIEDAKQDNVQIVVDNMDEHTTLNKKTVDSIETDEGLDKVSGDDGDNEGSPKLLRRTLTRLSSPLYDTGADYSDLESMVDFQDDKKAVSEMEDVRLGDDEDTISNARDSVGEDNDRKSVGSTRSDSGSDKEDWQDKAPMRQIRIDRRSRTTIFRVPRVYKRSRGQSDRLVRISGGRGRGRGRGRRVDQDCEDQPMSLMRRRVRFKNHPLGRFSRGLYYRALEISWLRLFVYLALIYFSAIAIMAALMHLTALHAVINTAGVEVDHDYERIFFFCAQTISTIGYGSLAPKPQSDLVNFYVCMLAIAGVIVSTLVTGLAWAKFSLPNASTIAFSDCILLTAFHSSRAIMFRVANSRAYGPIIEGSFRVSVIILNQRLGHKETHELKLVRNVWPVVRFGSIVTHIIDENSPLYHIPTDELLSGRHFFVVLFSGLDPVVGENLFSRKTYHSSDILVGHHFIDNIKITSEGVHVDLEAINGTNLAPELDLHESRLNDATADTGTSASIELPQEVQVTREHGEVFLIKPFESQSQGRRRRLADGGEFIDATPRAAHYAPM